jgi:hypothetical protein
VPRPFRPARDNTDRDRVRRQEIREPRREAGHADLHPTLTVSERCRYFTLSADADRTATLAVCLFPARRTGLAVRDRLQDEVSVQPAARVPQDALRYPQRANRDRSTEHNAPPNSFGAPVLSSVSVSVLSFQFPANGALVATFGTQDSARDDRRGRTPTRKPRGTPSRLQRAGVSWGRAFHAIHLGMSEAQSGHAS